ncbi:FAD-dependent oxidoreductase (plasmid) [Deinococcus taeanensis]|nr:FAD-dependent oxidoreductase [Deinococcus taeanensis]UBV44550.1 FAD-dependent oxidoreductase [Deinococcus taeanensis]
MSYDHSNAARLAGEPEAGPPTRGGVIIGAGQAGVPLARTLSEQGQRVLLIEAEHVAGTRVNEGCTPTKTIIGVPDEPREAV